MQKARLALVKSLQNLHVLKIFGKTLYKNAKFNLETFLGVTLCCKAARHDKPGKIGVLQET